MSAATPEELKRGREDYRRLVGAKITAPGYEFAAGCESSLAAGCLLGAVDRMTEKMLLSPLIERRIGRCLFTRTARHRRSAVQSIIAGSAEDYIGSKIASAARGGVIDRIGVPLSAAVINCSPRHRLETAPFIPPHAFFPTRRPRLRLHD